MKKSLKYMNIQNVPYSYSPIRKVVKFLGNLVASFEAVTYGRLFYRFIEIDKINALKLSKGKFALYLHLVYYNQNIQDSSKKWFSTNWRLNNTH